MPCDVKHEGGSTLIICRRGQRSYCQVSGCSRRSEALCDYPVTRKGVPGTCDLKLCASHRKPQPNKLDYCPPHAAVARAGADARA